MSSILIGIYLVFYLILANIRLDLAVLLLIIALPSYLIRFSVFGIPFTLLEAMILIAFAVWFFSNWKEIINNIKLRVTSSKLRANRYPFDVEMVLLLVISFIAVAIAGFSDSAFGIWKAYFFEPVLVFILVVNLFTNTKGTNIERKERMIFPEKILWALLISSLGVSVLAIVQKFTGLWIFNEFWADESARRVTSFFGYPNAVGLYLGPLLLLFMGWFFSVILERLKGAIESREKWLTKLKRDPIAALQDDRVFGLFLFITTVLSFLAIYFAKSKGALVGIAAGLIVFVLMINKRVRWTTIMLLLIVGLGILFNQSARDVVYKNLVFSKSLQIRQAQWQETWQMLKDGKFITGSGLANYQKEIKPYHVDGIFYNDGTDPEFHRHVVWNEEYKTRVWQPVEIYLYPHNIFFNFWVELGLAGVLLFGWIIFKFFYIAVAVGTSRDLSVHDLSVQKYKYLNIGLISAMTVIVVHGLVDVPYFKNDLAVMFWIVVALIGILKIQINKSS